MPQVRQQIEHTFRSSFKQRPEILLLWTLFFFKFTMRWAGSGLSRQRKPATVLQSPAGSAPRSETDAGSQTILECLFRTGAGRDAVPWRFMGASPGARRDKDHQS